MIPLRDKAVPRRLPVVTVLIIALNCYIFLKKLIFGNAAAGFIQQYALVPAEYLRHGTFSLEAAAAKNVTLISAMFLHGSWLHIIGNMWYLWLFGDNVEDRLGHVRFLLFYILCGIMGNAAHIIMNSSSSVPALGASGSIAGVMGAYFVLFPGARIVTLLPVLIFWTVAEVPAFFFLGIWFILQFLNGYFGGKAGDCVAWWAHIGGFVSGIMLTFIFAKRSRGRSSRRRS